MPSITDFGFFIAFITSLYYAFINFSQFQFIAVAVILSISTYLLTSGGPGRNMPPGPTGIPFLGHLPWILFTDSNEYFNKLYKKYGNIFTIRIGSFYTHIVSDYETIKAMGNHPNFQHRSTQGVFRELRNRRGIIDAEGDFWKHQRRFVSHALKDVGMGKLKLEEKIQDEINRLCRAIEKVSAEPIDMNLLLKRSSCNMIFSLAFNKSFEYDDPKFINRLTKLDENFKMSGIVQLILSFPWLVPFFSGMINKLKNNSEDYVKFQAEEFIKEHQLDFDPENPRDFIDLFLIEMSKEVTEENKEVQKTFDIEQLEYVIGDFFGAGTETSSTTIRWALLFMIHHPKIQEKVQAEIDEVIGKERLPTMADKRLLPFTTATLQEIERSASISGRTISRSNNKPVEFKGYKFPENSVFQFNLYSVHRDPAHWKNPLDFDPNRFIDEDGKVFRPPYLLPFGSGKRVCVGEAMAKMEIFLLFVTLLQRFTFEQDGNGLPTLESKLPRLVRAPVPHKLRVSSRNK